MIGLESLEGVSILYLKEVAQQDKEVRSSVVNGQQQTRLGLQIPICTPVALLSAGPFSHSIVVYGEEEEEARLDPRRLLCTYSQLLRLLFSEELMRLVKQTLTPQTTRCSEAYEGNTPARNRFNLLN